MFRLLIDQDVFGFTLKTDNVVFLTLVDLVHSKQEKHQRHSNDAASSSFQMSRTRLSSRLYYSTRYI